MGLFDGILSYIEEKAIRNGKLSKPLTRKMNCEKCKKEFTFTLKEFMNMTKKCPFCETENNLELDTSKEC